MPSVVSNSIRKISAVDASFQFDAFVSIAWRDPRYNVTVVDAFLNFYGDDSLSYTWAVGLRGFEPSLQFGNAVPVASVPVSYYMMQGAPSWTGVADTTSAWITSEQRVSGTFLQPQTLKDFPFDTQYATVTLQSSNWPSTSVSIVVAPSAATTFVPASDIDGWFKQSGKVAPRRGGHRFWPQSQSPHDVQRLPRSTPSCLVMQTLLEQRFLYRSHGILPFT